MALLPRGRKQSVNPGSIPLLPPRTWLCSVSLRCSEPVVHPAQWGVLQSPWNLCQWADGAVQHKGGLSPGGLSPAGWGRWFGRGYWAAADLMGKDENTADALHWPPSTANPHHHKHVSRRPEALLCHLGCLQVWLLIPNCCVPASVYLEITRQQEWPHSRSQARTAVGLLWEVLFHLLSPKQRNLLIQLLS